MKTMIISLIIYLGTVLNGNAQNSIEIIITNFSSNEGVVLVGLYNSEDGFLEAEFRGKEVQIENGKVTAVFTNVPDGTYAVSAFHDENEDDEINMFLGFYPMEDYATSNNAPAQFGPPKWKDAKFECKNGEKIVQKIVMM